MYKSKSIRNENLSAEFKNFYHEICDNKQSEAVNLDYSIDTIYAWADSNKLIDMPVFAVIRSNHGEEIIDWLKAMRKSAESQTHNFSDDWATLIELSGIVRSKFKAHEKFDWNLEASVKNLVENLFEEWRLHGNGSKEMR